MANYLGSVVNIATVTSGVDSVLAEDQNVKGSEIVAIQQTLGINPQRSKSTVVARLNEYSTMFRGFISENAAQLIYNTTTSVSLNPVSAEVNGTLLTWASPVVKSGLTRLVADSVYYAYLYNSSGNANFDVSTTVPVWDSALEYWKKTGDNGRRCVGYRSVNSSQQIRKFLNTVMGRVSEFLILDGLDSTLKRVVNLGAVSTYWETFSLAPFAPVHASHALLLPKLVGTLANDDAALGLSPIDLGPAAGNEASHQVRARAIAAGTGTSFGSTWLPISSQQAYFYRLFHIAGSGSTANIEVHGARVIR